MVQRLPPTRAAQGVQLCALGPRGAMGENTPGWERTVASGDLQVSGQVTPEPRGHGAAARLRARRQV